MKRSEVSYEILLGVGEFDVGRLPAGHGDGHSHDGPTGSYETERPLAREPSPDKQEASGVRLSLQGIVCAAGS